MRLNLLYVLICFPLMVCAQGKKCDEDRKFNLSDDGLAYQHFLSQILDREAHQKINSRTEKYFPVVIHVVVPDEYQPVSEAQVLNQLDVLNDDFAGRGENRFKLPEEFAALVTDSGLRFCLATIDPEGRPTNGITFTRTTVKNIALQTVEGGRIAIHYDQTGGKTGWDPFSYINIWVGEYGDILGSASFPGMASYNEEIGLIINISHFGSIGDAASTGYYSRGHTLTHEMGHFLGLKHIWGVGSDPDCNDSDDIADTPNAAGPYYGCPSGTQTSCGSSDMYQNFMDLTDDRCLAAFTHDQAARMQSVVDLYYHDLLMEGPCHPQVDPFDAWYDQLLWSYDGSSHQYIIYTTGQFVSDKKISVFSADGKLILEDTWQDQLSYLLNFNQVAAGIYFVSIEEGGQRKVRKIVVY